MSAGRRAGWGAAAALLLAAGCGRPAGPPAPAGAFLPVSPAAFRAMAARTAPTAPALLAIRWQYEDAEGPVRGRGAVRVAPPDSLRLDVGVPIVGRATVVLAGDSAWSRPAALVSEWAPSRWMIWAMFGAVRLPDGASSIEWSAATDHRLYRVRTADGVATTLELRGDTLLGATQTRGGRTIGQLALTRDGAGSITRAVATDVARQARFTVDVDRRDTGATFPHEIWLRP